MKKSTKLWILIFFIIGVLSNYLLGAFYEITFDINAWDEGTRSSVIAGIVVSKIITFIIYVVIEINESDKKRIDNDRRSY